MLVSQVMVKDVVTCRKDEELSKILRKMEEKKIHQLPVISDGKVVGMVFLKDLIRFSHVVEKDKADQFLAKVPFLSTKSGLQEAVKSIFGLGVRALPVVENGKLAGIISETDLIKNIEYLEDISPDRLMGGKIFAVREGDGLGHVLKIMVEQNISRVPVVDSQDRVTGCIDNLGLIKFLRLPKGSVRFSHLTTTERTSVKEFPARDYMRRAATMEIVKFSLKKIVRLLQSSEEVVVTDDERPVGIITPRDILELALMEEEIPIQIARAEKIDRYDKSRLDDTFRDFVKKFDKIVPVQRFFIYIDTHEMEGGRRKFSMRASFVTDRETFRAKSHGWDVWEATHMLLDNLERQILREKEKKIKSKRTIAKEH